MSSVRLRSLFVVPFCSIITVGLARPVESQMTQPSPRSAADSQVQAKMTRIFAGLLSDTSPHMRMGPTREATLADSVRAAAFVVAARTALGQYADVNVAERDGYYREIAWLVDQPIYHYTSGHNARSVRRGEFDVTKPISLLYKKDAQGQLKLVGAMYAVSDSTKPEQLDALLPISMAHWHQHVNMCNPGGNGIGPRSQTLDARTVFWIEYFFNITSAAECEREGGTFVAVQSGWMTHVYLFNGGDDPKVIWDVDDAGNLEVHTAHPAMHP